MTVAVVLGALLWIAEDAIGFRCFLELLFRSLVTRIPIGVKLDGELPVGALYLLSGSAAIQSQNFIVVTFQKSVLWIPNPHYVRDQESFDPDSSEGIATLTWDGRSSFSPIR